MKDVLIDLEMEDLKPAALAEEFLLTRYERTRMLEIDVSDV